MLGKKTKFKAEFEAIFNSITDAIVFTDAARQIVLVNPAFTKIFGYQLAEVSGETTQIIYADPDSYLQHGKVRFNDSAIISRPVYESEYRKKDGTLFLGETLGAHVKDEEGELLGFLGAIRDLSERKDTQKKLQDKINEYEATQSLLKESEERFKALHDASFGGVAIHNKGLILDCNQGLSDMTGYTNEELVGMDGLKLIAPSSLGLVLKNIKSGYSERYEAEGIRKDGSVYPLSIKGKNVSYKGREARVIEFQDITTEKQAVKALRESEERFRHTFETNPDPVILATLADGSIIDVNKAFVAVTGLSRLETIGHNSEQLNLWRDKALREQFREQLQTDGEVNNLEAGFNVKDDQVRTALLSARIISLREEPCILITLRDITSEKEVERVLVEMDQIKSDFISTAAHELRTPLTAIMGYTEILLDPLSSNSLSEEVKTNFLHEIRDRGEVLNRMIEDFLDISRIESGLPIPMDLREGDIKETLRKAFSYYQLHETGYTFQLILTEEAVGSTLTFDRHRISQVLENLLRNAVKYSPAGNKIVLRGKRINEGWEISVEDHGIGMNQEQLSRVFDKFYRANPADTEVKGLGLGMSIVKHIIEAHGGTIRAESQRGKGTTVSFVLPHIAS